MTIEHITQLFKEWNAKAFNNELPLPHFSIINTKTTLGRFCTRNVLGETIYRIEITNYFDRTLQDYIDTIVHEMIHYYIRYKDIKDTSSHGKEFKRMAKELNGKFGLHIKRCNPVHGGVSDRNIEKQRDRKTSFEYALIAKMNDNRCFASVIPFTHLTTFNNMMARNKRCKEYKIVKASWNNTFDLRHVKSRCTLTLSQIPADRYDELNKCKQLFF